MIKRITLISVLFLFGCMSNTSNSDSALTKKNTPALVKFNLYINSLTEELYFGYAIPHRILIDGQDQVKSHYVFDSTVVLENKEVLIKTIIDTSSYSIIKGTENYADKNYYYNNRDFNVRPKYVAVKRNE